MWYSRLYIEQEKQWKHLENLKKAYRLVKNNEPWHYLCLIIAPWLCNFLTLGETENLLWKLSVLTLKLFYKYKIIFQGKKVFIFNF